MDSFIKKIFENKVDNFVHLQFQKFSRGTFNNRAMIKASMSPKGCSLSTGNEFANELVRAVAEKLGDRSTQVNGVIVSTQNLRDKLPSKDLKQFMGIKQYVIDGQMTGHEIIKLQDAFPEAFFALSFSVGDSVLKIKPKAPKSAKPKTSDGPPKIDFCNLKTSDMNIVYKFVFERGWKKIEINHAFIIKDIDLPTGVADPNELRRLAKRKGTIVRKEVVDEKEKISEKEFIA